MPNDTMTPREAIEMMDRAIIEITDLRATIAMLAPKAEAYELLKGVINLFPKPSQGYGEDFVWRLKKRIEELQPKPAENAS